MKPLQCGFSYTLIKLLVYPKSQTLSDLFSWIGIFYFWWLLE